MPIAAQDEDDGRHGGDAVQGDDRNGEALLRRARSRLGRRLGRGWAPLPALVPDREHRPAEERDHDENPERDPGERVVVVCDVDDPQHEAESGQREVTEDQKRADLSRRALAHAAVTEPKNEEDEPPTRGDDPTYECSPFHRGPFRLGVRTPRIRDARIGNPSTVAPVGRIDGYAPIADYAAIGDGRTVALVARDGAIDWLCLPDLDSPSMFGAIVDDKRGVLRVATRRTLRIDSPLSAGLERSRDDVLDDRRQGPGHGRDDTSDGWAAPYRELVRRVEGLSGQVPMRWRVEPRPEYGSSVRLAQRAGVPVATHGRDAVAVIGWDAGDPTVRDGAIAGSFVAGAGHVAEVVLAAAHQEPLVFPSREQVSRRLSGTESAWREWHDERTCTTAGGGVRSSAARWR